MGLASALTNEKKCRLLVRLYDSPHLPVARCGGDAREAQSFLYQSVRSFCEGGLAKIRKTGRTDHVTLTKDGMETAALMKSTMRLLDRIEKTAKSEHPEAGRY